MTVHFVEVCREHSTVLAQCRCPSKDKIRRAVECPGPPACEALPNVTDNPLDFDGTTDA